MLHQMLLRYLRMLWKFYKNLSKNVILPASDCCKINHKFTLYCININYICGCDDSYIKNTFIKIIIFFTNEIQHHMIQIMQKQGQFCALFVKYVNQSIGSLLYYSKIKEFYDTVSITNIFNYSLINVVPLLCYQQQLSDHQQGQLTDQLLKLRE